MADQQTLDTPDLALSDYRAIREGNPLPEKTSDAPVVEEKPTADETAAVPEPAEDPEEPKPRTDKRPPKRGMVDEIDNLRLKNRALAERLAAIEASPKPAPLALAPPVDVRPPVAPTENAEPSPDSYSDYGAYTRDLIKWQIRAAQLEDAAKWEEKRARETQQARAEVWKSRVKAAAGDHNDYEAVALNKELPVTPVMAEAITDSDIGAEILYHLGSNPAEAARIAALSQVAQIREIGKIEFTLSQRADAGANDEGEESEPLQKTIVSKAPAPVARPQGGTISKPNPVRNLDGMTQAEYRAYRESGKIR